MELRCLFRPLLLAALSLFFGSSVLRGEVGKQDPEGRRARIQAMSRSEFNRLLRNFELYQELSEKDREQLRELYNAVEADPELERLMDAYRRWLRSLTPSQRSSLFNVPPDQRVDRIEALLEEQRLSRENRRKARQSSVRASREMMRRMKDLNSFRKWLEGWIQRRENENSLADREAAKKSFAWMVWYAASQGLFRDFSLDAVTEEEFQDLMSHFSEETRKQLRNENADQATQRIRLAHWLRAAIARTGRMALPRLAPIPQERMPHVIEVLSQEEQTRLRRTTGARLSQELAKLDYLMNPPGNFAQLQFPPVGRMKRPFRSGSRIPQNRPRSRP